ncbi:MAG: acetolactate synthase [Candidatus Omnitrophica bacterium]|nr:acetolactate synthase [Candidatus Omnitrophota bacterium]
MIYQLTVFLDNRPGRLNVLTGALSAGSINIRAMAIQDREEFGLVKLMVDKPDEALLLLKQNGFACALKPVLAIFLEDKVGGLHELTKTLSDAGLNIQDAYGMAAQSVFCIESKQLEKIEEVLEEKGFRILSGPEAYGM